MKLAQNSFKKLCLLRKKNWSAPAIISVFILACMILVYSFESIGLLNKERNLDLRLSNPESIIKTTYRDLKVIYSDKFIHHQIENSNEENMHLNKDFLLNKINLQSKISKENYIENIKKILIEGAQEQLKFENSVEKIEKNPQFLFTEKEKFFNKSNQINNGFDIKHFLEKETKIYSADSGKNNFSDIIYFDM